MAFAQNWESAKKHLYRGLVDKYLVKYNEEMASQCMELKEISDKDVAVFELIYLLDPTAPLCYKSVIYNDIESLGNEIEKSLPDRNKDILEMIKSGALLQFVERNHCNKKLITDVKEVTEALQNNLKSNKYFKLMYILKRNKCFFINHARCEEMRDLVEHLEKLDAKERTAMADSLIDNPLFFAWLDALGYGNQIKKWREIYELHDGI